MAQTPFFANIAELSALSVFTFLSSRFTVVSVFKVIFSKINQLTCHSFTGDLYMRDVRTIPVTSFDAHKAAVGPAQYIHSDSRDVRTIPVTSFDAHKAAVDPAQYIHSRDVSGGAGPLSRR